VFLRERSHETEAVLSSTLDLFAQGSHRVCRKANSARAFSGRYGSTPTSRTAVFVAQPLRPCADAKEDGSVLFESTAILNYLEATWPDPPLAPADARGRALVDMHMKLCDLQLTRYAGTIIFPKRFLPKDKWNKVAITEAKAEIEKHFAILSQHLAASTYWLPSSSRSLTYATCRSWSFCR
jgi:hypothetical protein